MSLILQIAAALLLVHITLRGWHRFQARRKVRAVERRITSLRSAPPTAPVGRTLLHVLVATAFPMQALTLGFARQGKSECHPQPNPARFFRIGMSFGRSLRRALRRPY
jgi:hypothetical protein